MSKNAELEKIKIELCENQTYLEKIKIAWNSLKEVEKKQTEIIKVQEDQINKQNEVINMEVSKVIARDNIIKNQELEIAKQAEVIKAQEDVLIGKDKIIQGYKDIMENYSF